MSLIGFKAKVMGRVQGVYYRKNTQKQAIKFNLTGWVKNDTDGSVLVEAHGEEKQIKQLIAWLHKGPLFARVKQIHIDHITYHQDTDFLIK